MPRAHVKASASVYCPFCRKHTEVTVVPVPIEGMAGHTGHVFARWEKSSQDVWWLGKTHCCNNAVLVKNNGERVYPTPQPSPTDDRVPLTMKDDLDEAKLCASVGAWRGCAVLARRAIQSACIDKGAKAGDDLVKQIPQLVDKRIITSEIGDWATEVRLVGNDAAHPNEVSVSKYDAEDILRLAEQFLHVLYVAPAIAAERKAGRTKPQP